AGPGRQDHPRLLPRRARLRAEAAEPPGRREPDPAAPAQRVTAMDPSVWDRVASEPFLGVLVGVIGSLVALVSGMLCWLVARSLWYGRVRRLRDAFWHGLGRELVGVIGDPDAEAAWIARARSHHPDVLRYCLNEYMIRTCGDYKEGCARLYRNLGLLDRDLVELRKAGWSSRMRALRRVASVVTEDHRAE